MGKKGNFSLKGEAGDLLIKVNVKEDPYFKRVGSDLHTEKKVSLTQGLLGAKVKVRTLDGTADIQIK